jgi:hypothetical protein
MFFKIFARPSTPASPSPSAASADASLSRKTRVLAWLLPHTAGARDICRGSVADTSSTSNFTGDVSSTLSPSDASSALTPGSSVESFVLVDDASSLYTTSSADTSTTSSTPGSASADSESSSDALAAAMTKVLDLAREYPDLYEALCAPPPKAIVVDSHTNARSLGPRRATLSPVGLGLGLDARKTLSAPRSASCSRQRGRRHVTEVAPSRRSVSAPAATRSRASDMATIAEDAEDAEHEITPITPTTVSIVVSASSPRSITNGSRPQRRVFDMATLAEEPEPVPESTAALASASLTAAPVVPRLAITPRPRPRGRVFDMATLGEEDESEPEPQTTSLSLTPALSRSFGSLSIAELAAEPVYDDEDASLPSPGMLHPEWQPRRSQFLYC